MKNKFPKKEEPQNEAKILKRNEGMKNVYKNMKPLTTF